MAGLQFDDGPNSRKWQVGTMKRSIALGLGTLGLAAAMAGAPVEFTFDSTLFDAKAAFAAPGNGKGHGQGHGPDKDGLAAKSEKGLGASSNANGRAIGHARKDAVSGVEGVSAAKNAKKDEDGVNLNSAFQGSFHAVNASAMAKQKANVNSQVHAVQSYVDQVSMESIDIGAAAEAAAMASNHTVTKDMLDAVHGLAGVEVDDEATGNIAAEAADIQSGGDPEAEGEGEAEAQEAEF